MVEADSEGVSGWPSQTAGRTVPGYPRDDGRRNRVGGWIGKAVDHLSRAVSGSNGKTSSKALRPSSIRCMCVMVAGSRCAGFRLDRLGVERVMGHDGSVGGAGVVWCRNHSLPSTPRAGAPARRRHPMSIASRATPAATRTPPHRRRCGRCPPATAAPATTPRTTPASTVQRVGRASSTAADDRPLLHRLGRLEIVGLQFAHPGAG